MDVITIPTLLHCKIRTKSESYVITTSRNRSPGHPIFQLSVDHPDPSAPLLPKWFVIDGYEPDGINDMYGWMGHVRNVIGPASQDRPDWLHGFLDRAVYALPWTTRLCWETAGRGDIWVGMVAQPSLYGLTFQHIRVEILRPSIYGNEFPVAWFFANDLSHRRGGYHLSKLPEGYVDELEGHCKMLLKGHNIV